jgi:hypothetical protein
MKCVLVVRQALPGKVNKPIGAFEKRIIVNLGVHFFEIKRDVFHLRKPGAHTCFLLAGRGCDYLAIIP